MEMMYHRTKREFVLVTATEAIRLAPSKTYQDVKTMVEDVKEPLAQYMIDVDYSVFGQPDLNLGRWFGYPESPKYPKYAYFAQQDGSMTLYTFVEKVKVPSLVHGIQALKGNGYEVYYNIKNETPSVFSSQK